MIALKGDRADEGKIVINGKTLFCDDSAYYDYLGYTLECLYRIDKETGKNYLIFAEPLDTKTMSFVMSVWRWYYVDKRKFNRTVGCGTFGR